MFEFSKIQFIELVSVFLLFMLLCGAISYHRTSASRRKEFLNSADSAHIGDYQIDPRKSIDSDAANLPICSRTEQYAMTTNKSDENTHVPNNRTFSTECELLPLLGDRHRIVYENTTTAHTITMEVPEETAAGPCAPRRSERARKATRRFEESWYNEHLQCLSSALDVY